MRNISRTFAATMIAAATVVGSYCFFASPLVPSADARLKDHPRLAAASAALADARAYLETTPSDFRGHKDAAHAACIHAMREIALAAGEKDRAVIGVPPATRLEHVHQRLWTARERIRDGRAYILDSRGGFFGHKDAALKWIDATLAELDAILVD